MFIVEKVRFKNFRSFGNQWTEVDLTRSKNTVISGKNGAGKSSSFGAVSLALFGKVVGVNKARLVNDINGKDCVVEVWCRHGDKEIFVRRGIKPAIFDIIIDGELVDQSASSRDYQKWFEEYILGFNLASFQQVCFITGQTYTPFFLLSAGARRKMVEDLLSITIFSKMYSLHLLESSQIKEKINKTVYDIEVTEDSLVSLKNALNEISSRDSSFREMILDGISVLQSKVDALNVTHGNIIQKIKDESLDNIDLIGLKKLETKLNKAVKIENDLDRSKSSAEKFIKFLSENDNCPTCNSSLDSDFKETHTCQRQEKIVEVESAKSGLSIMMSDLSSEIDLIKQRQDKYKSLKLELSSIERDIDRLNAQIKEENKKLDSVSSNNESSIKRDIIDRHAKLEELKEIKIQALVDKQYNELQGVILKDSGIKTRIINQMLPKMNQILQHYVQQMELGCNIVIDENFNEVIYRRFKDPTTYSDMSAGEKTRIDIAMFFTWREIAKAKNSLNCNLLFLDEIFDNTLDDVGLDIFISLLKKDFPDSNIFMISHRPEVIDKFESSIRLEKRGNFSQLV